MKYEHLVNTYEKTKRICIPRCINNKGWETVCLEGTFCNNFLYYFLRHMYGQIRIKLD